MNLPPSGIEFYVLELVTTPPLDPDAWEASFDAGETWHQADVDAETPTLSRWLLAGPSATSVPVDAITVPASCLPLVRAEANPEVIVRAAPRIHITTPPA